MPPINMTVGERAALKQLAMSPRLASEIEPDFAERLLDQGLAVRQALRLSITTKGQLELLRQRYRTLGTRRAAPMPGGEFIAEPEDRPEPSPAESEQPAELVDSD